MRTGIVIVVLLLASPLFRVKKKQDAAGTVSGVLVRMEPGTVVSLQNEKAVFTTHPEPATGKFFFSEVKPGTYTLNVYPADADTPLISAPGIEVRMNENTDAGLIGDKDPLQGSWLTWPAPAAGGQ